MNIIEEHTYRSATLRQAPIRATRAEAEVDEARGVELEAFLRLLPGLTVEQWQAVESVWYATRGAPQYAMWGPARDAAQSAVRDVTRYAARHAAKDTPRFAAWRSEAGSGSSWDAAWDATWDAARALVVRDLLSWDHFDILIGPMRASGIDFYKLGYPQ
jgi:hypothetical protein